MCIMPKTPTYDAPTMPAEPAKAQAPDGGAVRSTTGRRVMDRMRSATSTILTSGSGVTSSAPTEKKTLLGG